MDDLRMDLREDLYAPLYWLFITKCIHKTYRNDWHPINGTLNCSNLQN